MFRLVEKFFRGLAFQVPQEWQHDDEQEDAEFLHIKAEVLKEVIFRNFKNGWEKEIRCEDGWIQIITECHSDLSTLDENYEIFQIKQKFGTLRFYCEPTNPELRKQFVAIIDEYEKRSARTCEKSGEKGVLMKKDGYYQTLNPELGKLLGFEMIEQPNKS